MALADIVKRIDEDAQAEADVLIRDAQSRADQTLAASREQAERESAAILAQGAADAAAEAETLRAAARLAARDRLVAAKGQLVDRALTSAAQAVVALPDDAYAELVARSVVAASRGGERLYIATADRDRLESRLPKAIEQVAGRELGLAVAEEPADVEHGVVLVGDRTQVDLSVAAAIEERRDELAMVATDALFGSDAGPGE